MATATARCTKSPVRHRLATSMLQTTVTSWTPRSTRVPMNIATVKTMTAMASRMKTTRWMPLHGMPMMMVMVLAILERPPTVARSPVSMSSIQRIAMMETMTRIQVRTNIVMAKTTIAMER